MDTLSITPDLKELITVEQAWHYNIIPFKTEDDKIGIYFDENKDNTTWRQELELVLGRKLVFKPLNDEILNRTLSIYYRRADKNRLIQNIESNDEDKFLDKIILESLNQNASDIHLEIFSDKARIRYRIDGKLLERYFINKTEYPALVNKIKIYANLDISEKRLPQDGRIGFKKNGISLDIRISVIPTIHGEKIVLRLLGQEITDINIKELGFTPVQITTYQEELKKTCGIILVSGPTGSGKTTTLYASLKHLNSDDVNILTIEDPIEYTINGVNQVQVKESIGLDFATTLRTFLRQDPDILMIGEIRDVDTAQMAIRAALTGHLVLSTIHTNSAWGTVSRLIDMGIPPYLIADTLTLSMAQRLIRKLCPVCKKRTPYSQDMLPSRFKIPEKIEFCFIPVGCPECYYTGYKGRKALYEMIPITEELAEIVKFNLKRSDQYFQTNKIKRLSDIAFDLVLRGETSPKEAYPIIISN